MKEYFIRYFVNPIIWRFVKQSKRFFYLREIKKNQWSSLEKNRERQAQQLYRIIKYADEHIKYYHDLIKSRGIIYSSRSIFEDIGRFPILTKKDIRNNFQDLINNKIKAHPNTSGGSTGEQAIFLQDKQSLDYNTAVTMLFNEWAGRQEGDLMIKLWGSERDILLGGLGFKGFLVRNLMNEILLNTFKLSPHDLENYIKAINRHKPTIIAAYVQSIYEISKFIKHREMKVYSPSSIITSAGTLYSSFRKTIEEAFNCPVFNRYGSREVGTIACECSHHAGLHINTFGLYLEILDDNYLPIQREGQTGEIYLTTLQNYAMPLIRYKIGDIGEFSNDHCPCQRGLPLLKSVLGRTNSILKINGKVLDSTALTTSFYYFKSINKYQVVQRGDNFVIKVVIGDDDMWQSDKERLLEKLKKILGADAKIQFKNTKEIPPTPSGKYLFIINENK